MTEIETLFRQVHILPYPACMRCVLGEISGRAFFPGGTGLLNGKNTISDKRIMVLGQDFDSEENYNKSLLRLNETNPTWTNILSLLKEAGINPTDCFFTNAIMGVRAGNNGVGKSPAFKYPEFLHQCQDFFLLQLETQKPDLILVLGKMTGEFLAGISEHLKPWKSLKSITAIDEAGQQIQKNVEFSNGVNTTLLLLTHPSYRPANVHRRKFNIVSGPDGSAAEIRMINHALRVNLDS